MLEDKQVHLVEEEQVLEDLELQHKLLLLQKHIQLQLVLVVLKAQQIQMGHLVKVEMVEIPLFQVQILLQ